MSTLEIIDFSQQFADKHGLFPNPRMQQHISLRSGLRSLASPEADHQQSFDAQGFQVETTSTGGLGKKAAHGCMGSLEHRLFEVAVMAVG